MKFKSFTASVPRAQPATPTAAPRLVRRPLTDPPPLSVELCRRDDCEIERAHPLHDEDFPPPSADGKPVGKGRRPPGQRLTPEERRARQRERRARRRERLQAELIERAKAQLKIR